MVLPRTFSVECDTGCKYTQTLESPLEQPIYNCGMCGSLHIRVWVMIYDALSLAIHNRMYREEDHESRDE
jgi:hypothetical protein